MTVEMNYFVTSNSRPILMQFNTTNSTPQNITCATHTGDQRAKNGMSVLICFWAAFSRIVCARSFQ